MLLLSVRNEQGAAAELGSSDLEVRVNGKRTTVEAVQRLGRPALRYCLLFDSSGSERSRWQQHVEEGTTLLGLAQPGRDYGLLVAFNDKAFLDAEGTDPQKIASALSKAGPLNGTALYDAVIACANQLAKDASPTDLRVMFILSDGDDNSSRHNREQALRSLLMAGARVYAIGQRNAEDPNSSAGKGIHALKQFAEKTGGKAYMARGTSDVQQSINDISTQLSSTFSASVRIVEPVAGGFVYTIDVKCRKKNVLLSAPKEFFVPLH